MAQTTDPQDELLTEVDQNNNVIGPIARKIAHNAPQKFYRTIAVLVFNDQNQVLLQQRSATKDLYPNCWDLSVGGHVDFGQTYEETATKELGEELGVKVTSADLKNRGEVLVKLPNSNEFFNVFEYKLKADDKLTLEEKEVSSIKWMSLKEIIDSINNQTIEWYPRPLQILTKFYM